MAANTPGQQPRLGMKQPQQQVEYGKPPVLPLQQAPQQPQRASLGEGSKVPLYSRGRVRARKLPDHSEQRLQAHLEGEEQRIKQLTEAVLYEFLPAALNVMLPHSDDMAQELDADRCRAVASAALCVSALMNAPPGFLEFLLCVPWRKLSQLYPSRQDSIDKLISHLHVTPEERRKLVNTRIDPLLMPTVLDFLYRDDHVDSAPPMLQLTHPPARPGASGTSDPGTGGMPAAVGRTGAETPADVGLVNDSKGSHAAQPSVLSAAMVGNGTAASSEGGDSAFRGAQEDVVPVITLEVVAAVLDGATPLHCAALRGNPAQVDHLLYCGADPALRTAAGELPIELVPVCGDKGPEPGQRLCRCMCAQDQEVWECRSRLARSLIARRCVLSLRLGLLAWIKLVVYCLLCCLGRVGNYLDIARPAIAAHVVRRAEAKRHEARERAQGLMSRLRTEAAAGRNHLASAKHDCHSHATHHHQGLPSVDVSMLLRQSPIAALSSHTTSNTTTISTLTASQLASSGRVGSKAGSEQVAHALSPSSFAAAAAGDSDSSGTNADAVGTDPALAGVANSTGGHPHSTLLTTAPQHDLNYHLQESDASVAGGTGSSSEAAFKCFVRAVHALQSLDLQGNTMPQVFADAWERGELGGEEAPGTHVLEDEQAELYCCWAESVLIKFKHTSRACSCPGCAALTVQAVRMAHAHTTRLFTRVEKRKEEQPERWRAVGQALVRVVYAHICLLLGTDAQASPTRASVWRAEQCLREWDKLARLGLASEAGLDTQQVDALHSWAKASDSDLYIAEALMGTPLQPNQPLQEVVAATVGRSATGAPYLLRPVTSELVLQLEQAITLACTPSPALAMLAKQLTQGATAEMAAAGRLRDVVSGRGLLSAAHAGAGEGAAALQAALDAASAFPRLSAEVEAARGLMERWLRRTEAVERLETVVEDIRLFAHAHPLAVSRHGAERGPGRASGVAGADSLGNGSAAATSSALPSASVAAALNATAQGVDACNVDSTAGGSVAGGGGAVATESAGAGAALLLAEWDQRIHWLEAAISQAKDANISVNKMEFEISMSQTAKRCAAVQQRALKAKRLLKELQAQSAAAEAHRQLEATMAKRPAGAGALKTALSRAEAAATALSGAGGTPGLADVLLPLVQAGRKRLEVEKAAEMLHRAVAQARSVADLPRLEAAILNARKVGAEELDMEAYKAASDLRAQLSDASRAKAALEAAVRGMQKHTRLEDADVVEQALRDCTKWDELLAPEVARAREALQLWRTQTAAEGRLLAALHSGAGPAELTKSIAEASAAGVKVAAAKRVLKLMHALEAAVAATVDGPAAQYSQLRQKVEAAEQGGVTAAILGKAQRLMRQLQRARARDALEAALRSAPVPTPPPSSGHGPHRGPASTVSGTASGAINAAELALEQRIAALRAAAERGEEILGPREGAPLTTPIADDGSSSEDDGVSAGASVDEGLSSSGGAAGWQGGMSRSGSRRSQLPGSLGGSSAALTDCGRTNSGESSAQLLDSAAAAALVAAASALPPGSGPGEAGTCSRPACTQAAEPPAATMSLPGSCDSRSAPAAAVADAVNAADGSACCASPEEQCDPADLAALRDLLQRVYEALDTQVLELQRCEKHRLTAERRRKEALAKERAERARLDAERVAREKVEHQEREKAAAEKRERAKAAQAHVRQALAKASGVGSGKAAAQRAQTSRDTPLADQASARAGRGSTAATPATPNPVGSAPQAAVPPIHRTRPCPCSSATRSQTVPTGVGLFSQPATNPPGLPPQAPGPVPRLHQQHASDVLALAPPPPPPRATLPAPHGFSLDGAVSLAPAAMQLPLLLPDSPHAKSVGNTLHTRGDSLDILGEPSLKLDRGMMEALELTQDQHLEARQDAADQQDKPRDTPQDIRVELSQSSRIDVTHKPSAAANFCNGGAADLRQVGLCSHLPDGSGAGSGGIALATVSQRPGLEWLPSVGDCIFRDGSDNSSSTLAPLSTPQPAHGSLSQCASSHFSSATSADDMLTPDGSTGVAVSSQSDSALSSDATARTAAARAVSLPTGSTVANSGDAVGAAANKPRFGFVDLGGASWGVDNPLMARDAPSSLFNSPFSEFLAGLPGGDAATGGWPSSAPFLTSAGNNAAAPRAADAAAAAAAGTFGRSEASPSIVAAAGSGGGGTSALPCGQIRSNVGVQVARLDVQQQQTEQQPLQQQQGTLLQLSMLQGQDTRQPLPQQQLMQLHRQLQQQQVQQQQQQQQQQAQAHLQAPYTGVQGLTTTMQAPAGAAQGMVGSGSQAGNGSGGLVLQATGPGGGNAGGSAHNSFWTPPSMFAPLRVDAGDVTHSAQAVQQYMAVSTPGGGMQLVEIPLGLGSSNVVLTPRSGARACRYFTQGFCRDGDRCRFAHTMTPAVNLQIVQLQHTASALQQANTMANLMQQQQQQQQQHTLASMPAGGSGSCPPISPFIPRSAGGGGSISNPSMGLFAFGAPGSDVFSGRPEPAPAPAGSTGGSAPNGALSADAASFVSSFASAMSPTTAAGSGHQPRALPLTGTHTVQLRNTVTGATFPAVLTLAPHQPGQQQQVLLSLATPGGALTPMTKDHPQLPDDLSFSPSTSS